MLTQCLKLSLVHGSLSRWLQIPLGKHWKVITEARAVISQGPFLTRPSPSFRGWDLDQVRKLSKRL